MKQILRKKSVRYFKQRRQKERKNCVSALTKKNAHTYTYQDEKEEEEGNANHRAN